MLPGSCLTLGAKLWAVGQSWGGGVTLSSIPVGSIAKTAALTLRGLAVWWREAGEHGRTAQASLSVRPCSRGVTLLGGGWELDGGGSRESPHETVVSTIILMEAKKIKKTGRVCKDGIHYSWEKMGRVLRHLLEGLFVFFLVKGDGDRKVPTAHFAVWKQVEKTTVSCN